MPIRTSHFPYFNIVTQRSGSVIIVDSIITLPYSNRVSLPQNLTLIFEHGSIFAETQCTIEGNNTTIVAGRTQIFSARVSVDGTWNIKEAYPEWFGAKSYDTMEKSSTGTFSASAINKAIVMKRAGDVSLANGIYRIKGSINVPCGIRLVGTPGNGLSEQSDYKANGTILQVDANFNNDTGYRYVIGVNVREKIVDNEVKGLEWTVPSPQPVTTIENIIIRNFDESKLSDTIPIGIAIGGGANILHVAFNNVPRAIKWTFDNYANAKNTKYCVYYNTIQPSDSNDLPIAFDMGRMGDALDFSFNLIHGDPYHNKALQVQAVYGATILGNTFNSDIIFIENKGVMFSGNHVNNGAQIRVEFSQISMNSNYIEKQERPSIVILGTQYHEGSTVDIQNTVFYLRGLINRLTGIIPSQIISQINEYKNFSDYDIVVNDDCIVSVKNCFLDTMLVDGTNFQPTGILIARTDRNSTNYSQSSQGLTDFNEFNEDSYVLSFNSTISKGEVVNKNIDIPDVNSPSVLLLGWAQQTTQTFWIGATGDYEYAYQVIWDKERCIIGVKNNNVIIGITQNPLHFSQNGGRGMAVRISGTSPLPLRLYRKKVNTPYLSNYTYDHYVDIPTCAGMVLVDNGFDVSGYKWKNVNDDTIISPISDSIQKIQEIHEMHKVGVNVVCTAEPTEDWTANDPLPTTLPGWLDGDKISILGSETTYIFKTSNIH